MSTTEMSVNEMVESLTGFDELAIENHFHIGLSELEKKPTTAVRALVFIHKTREGLSPQDAKSAAMNLPLGQANTYFAEEPEEFDPEHPDGEPGKDDSLDA